MEEGIGFFEAGGDPPELVQNTNTISAQTATGPMQVEATLLVQEVPTLAAEDWAGQIADHHVNLYIPRNVTTFLQHVTAQPLHILAKS